MVYKKKIIKKWRVEQGKFTAHIIPYHHKHMIHRVICVWHFTACGDMNNYIIQRLNKGVIHGAAQKAL